MSCLGYVLIVSHHLGGLESVELMHQLAGGMRIVLVKMPTGISVGTPPCIRVVKKITTTMGKMTMQKR